MALGSVTGSSAVWALNPSFEISQYGHRGWRSLDGFDFGTVVAVGQTTDGYIWLGTAYGLLRLDGARSVPWRAPANAALPNESVRTLLGTRDGALWVGTWHGLARLKNGSVFAPPSMRGKAINAIEEDPDGTVWVAGTTWGEADHAKAFLCFFRQSGSEACQGDDGRLGQAIVGLYRDSAGSLWVVGTDRVWKWGPGTPVSYTLPKPIYSLRAITGSPDGAVVLAAQDQVLRIADGKVERLPLPAWTAKLSFTKVWRDRDGALWLAAPDFGLLHLHEGRADAYTMANGLSGDQVLDMFEDREGDMWISTSRGLDQFRTAAGALLPRNNEFKGSARTVLATRDGSVWGATTSAVYRIRGAEATELLAAKSLNLFGDRRGRVWVIAESQLGYIEDGRYVPATHVPAGEIGGMAEDSSGNLWIAHREAGLLRILPDDSVVATPWASVGRPVHVSTIAVDPTDDSIWMGTWSGALANVVNGRIRRFIELGQARDASRVKQIRIEPDGTIWAANGNGLNRVRQGRVTHLNNATGLPCNQVYASVADRKFLWIYGRCGLIRASRGEVDAWADAVDRGAPVPKVSLRVLDQWDGIAEPQSADVSGQLTTLRNATPMLTQAQDGRVWVVTANGFVAVDPERITGDSAPPPVHVEQLVSDGTRYEARTGLRLPPLQGNVAIDYTGLTFVAPERVQFRYKLEGRDTGWQEVGNRRQAFYTDLRPGRYRFSVTARKDDSAWNSEGDTLEFSIEAAWWQTSLFRAACIVAFGLACYLLYQLRISQLSRRFATTLDARVAERLRIARDLHDTLLQSFQGHVIRLQTALQLWPSVDGHRILEEGIDQAADAITEGRDAVQGLRSDPTERFDLAGALRALGLSLTAGPALPAIRFGMEIRGRPRELHPVVRDDVVRIAGEALRNATRHAEPKRIELEIHYDDRELRLRIVDDGKGMERSAIQRSREGHFGLRGMRERAKLIGGKISIWSRLTAGTEVELTVPARRAYAAVSDGIDDAAALAAAEPADGIDT